MVGKKSTGQAVSKVSSATAPALSSATQSASRSAILCSAFSPSRFQLSLFASVIQGLDSHQIRIHDTITGRLKCEHAIGPSDSITCLSWGYYGSYAEGSSQTSLRRKRKRSEDANGMKDHDDAVVAIGTTLSEVQFFSPSAGRVVGYLKGAHTQGIEDFKFVDDGTSSVGWSLGGDGKLVRWNLRDGSFEPINFTPKEPARTLLPLSHSILCASHVIYSIDLEPPQKMTKFTGPTHYINTLIASPSKHLSPPSFLATADSERHVYLFGRESKYMIASLVTVGDVDSATLFEASESNTVPVRNRDALAVVTKDGDVELFPSPFEFGDTSAPKVSESLKPTKANKPRQSSARIKIETKGKTVHRRPIIGASFDGDDIVVVWTESGLYLNFERLPWRDPSTGNMLFTGLKEITTSKSAASKGVGITNGVKELGRSHVDESRTVITKGGDEDEVVKIVDAPEIIQISSAEEESESEDEYDEKDRHLGQARPMPVPLAQRLTNGDTIHDGDVAMEDIASENEQNDQATEEPSFGDLIRAKAPDTIDVAAVFPDQNKQALAPLREGASKAPSGVSLGVVLSQSLRTNDVTLLETCFHVTDLNIVRATIERLDSSLAASLLQKLAERLHSRPGRAGSLMVWVQWTLVAHGGYLAGQPEVVDKLRSLHRVVKERANSLQPLLSLKGKLDMLEAQMNLRKSMQSRFGAAEVGKKDDEDAVIYVEGQEESSSDDEKDGEATSVPSKIKVRRQAVHAVNEESGESDNDMNDMDDMSVATDDQGIHSDGSTSESDEERVIDDEESATDERSNDEASEEEVDHDDVDSIDEDEESESETPATQAAKHKLSNGAFPKRK